jgi:integrase
MATRIKRKLDDQHISALLDFSLFGIYWDTDVRGLRLRVGPRKATWQFFAEHSVHGRRSTTHRTLGFYPVMGTIVARKAALVEAGRVAAKHLTPGKRTAVRLGAALDDYLKFLKAKAGRRGKPPRHAVNVANLRSLYLAEFERWPLADLSDNPAILKEWHERITKEAGPISANRAAEALRACYRYQLKLDRSLPPALPTSGIVFNPETPSGQTMAFKDFPKWREVWEKIESPIHRSFHLTNLLTGCRPGELSRLRREDIKPRERVFIIRSGKAGADIRVVLSVPIVRALRITLDAHQGELVFPDCHQLGRHDPLPARGVQLRRAYRTVAADVGVDEMLSHFLLSHAPAGISQRYVSQLTLNAGPAMRSAQAKISKRIGTLLKLSTAKLGS